METDALTDEHIKACSIHSETRAVTNTKIRFTRKAKGKSKRLYKRTEKAV